MMVSMDGLRAAGRVQTTQYGGEKGKYIHADIKVVISDWEKVEENEESIVGDKDEIRRKKNKAVKL